MPAYQPPFQITPAILALVADISEQPGLLEMAALSRHQVGTKLGLNSDQLHVFDNIKGEMSLMALMSLLKRTDRTKFRAQILNPLIEAGLVESTILDKPTSSKQKYRLKMEDR